MIGQVDKAISLLIISLNVLEFFILVSVCLVIIYSEYSSWVHKSAFSIDLWIPYF